MPGSTIEILGPRQRRRRWSLQDKLRIVAESEEPGAVLRAVAARHDIVPTLLGTWRRQARRGQLRPEQPPQLLPVRMTEAHAFPTVASSPSDPPPSRVEITLPNGVRVTIDEAISTAALRRVMTVLRG